MEMDNHFAARANAAVVPIKLKSFVNLTMDVASASPRRYFFEARTQYVFNSWFSICNVLKKKKALL